jgi:hypothetical protein
MQVLAVGAVNGWVQVGFFDLVCFISLVPLLFFFSLLGVHLLVSIAQGTRNNFKEDQPHAST